MSSRRNEVSEDGSSRVRTRSRIRFPMSRQYSTLFVPIFIAVSLGVSACSDDDVEDPTGEGGASNGGTTTSGGASKGGTTSKGGTANGGAAVAGTAGKATGGAATGGASNGGNGGAVTTGGTATVGGAAGSGATPSTGGIANGGSAGAPATGGAQTTGGTAAGGAAGTPSGGAVVAGAGAAGAPTTGGATTAGAAGTTNLAGAAGTTDVAGAAGASTGGTTSTAGAGGAAGSGGDSTAGTAGTAGTGPTAPVAILRYLFEDDASGTAANDETTNNNDGTLSNVTFTANTDGRNGAAADLANAASSISIPPNLFTNVHALTVAAWVRPSATPAADTRLFEFGNGTTFLRLNMNLSGAIALQFQGSSGGLVQFGMSAAVEATPTHFPLNVWKHVAVTVSTAGSAIYIDGKIVASLATPIDPALLTATNNLIGNSPAGTNAFQGRIDEVAIYNGVLPLSEIRTLAAPKTDYVMYHFDEGGGTTTEDASDRNYDGTLVNATWVSGPSSYFGTAVKMDNPSNAPATQYIQLGGNVVANCGANHTFAGWVSIESHNLNARIVEFAADPTRWINIQTWMQSGTNPMFAMAFNLPTDRTARLQGISWTLNDWYHIAVVRSTDPATPADVGRLVRFYRNGIQVGTNPSVINTGATLSGWTWAGAAANNFGRGVADSVVVGNPPATPPPTPIDVRGFDGSVDEWLFSCRAYTPDEIRQLAYRP